MSQAGIVDDEAQLLTAYQAYDSKLLSRGLIVANLIGMVGMPSGVVLDYFLYRDKIWDFLAIRLGVDVILAFVVLTLFLFRNRLSILQVKVLGIFSALVFNFAFCLMIYTTQGAASPFYAALNLIIMSWSVLLPWSAIETGIICFISLVAYVVACVANPTFADPASFPLLANNSSFILITTAVCVAITFFLSRARFAEFRLRHQLDVQNQKLQDLDRLKTQFFSNISHELRTPLTLILSPLETLLGRGEELDPRVHDSLMMIHRNTLRLLKLINDLLDLTRLDQGAEMLRKKAFPLGLFLKGMVESVRHLGLGKQLRIKVEEGDGSVDVLADPARLEKVLINLLTNAIKYTPAGGAITVRWRGEAAQSVIEVEDTGVGIPAEDLSRIFDRFHQVRSNLANQNQGVGIGLALARELVEHHQGKLEVESQPGQGSLFRILLPVDAEEAADQPSEAVLPDAATDEPFEKAFRSADRTWRSSGDVTDEVLPVVGSGENIVLVADDETDMRRYVVSLLAEDYRVVQTQHGNNVAALVAEHEPDLVLLDWMMPGKDGLTVCRELRAEPGNHDLKIVLLTARIDEKSKIEALKSGADDFLTKPFSSVEVRTRISNLLRAARLQRDLRQRNAELTAIIDKLQRTETMLIQSEKMNAIGSLSAGLLHEINNPLNYTLTAISLANQFKDSLNADMQEIVADIQDGMIRIRDVITHLKNFAYPEKPGTESLVSIEEVLQAARKIVAGEMDGIEVTVDLPAPLIVHGQKTQLTHLFINLLNNAAKALNERPPAGRKAISVSARTDEGTLTLTVADNGPGIAPENLTRLFEPFFTTRDVGAGMGMGLSICHTIVETHRGSITVANRPEGGAIFTVKLPIAQEAPILCTGYALDSTDH